MEFSIADQIWNRAAMRDFDDPKPGDTALGALLLLHGLAMNGGIHHAIDCISAEEFADAIAGFEYFGIDQFAAWLRSAETDPILKEWTDENEMAALYRYAEFIPNDDYLVTRFEEVYASTPDEFAPLKLAGN